VNQELSLVDWDRLRIDLSWAYEGPVSPEFQEETSPHFGQSIFLIRKGGVVVTTPEGRVKGGEGDWVFPVQGRRHQKFLPDTRVLSVHLDFQWPGGHPFFSWDPALVVSSGSHPLWEVRAEVLVRFIETRFGQVRWGLRTREADILTWRQLQRHFFDWFDLVLCDLIEDGHRPPRLIRLDPRLQAGLELLKNQAFTVSFREQDIAAYAGLSVSQWNRLFRKELGITPREFYDQRRLESALDRIRAGGPFKEIAFDLGFCSLAHFSGWFHRKTGLTPTEFRQKGD
jgi:AraC-like DNA-binding protein